MVKFLCVFIIIMAVFLALLGGSFSLGDFLDGFASAPELLQFDSINFPVFPSYSPSQDDNTLERIGYFFTDYLPAFFVFIGNLFTSTLKLFYYPFVNIFRISRWLFSLI